MICRRLTAVSPAPADTAVHAAHQVFALPIQSACPLAQAAIAAHNTFPVLPWLPHPNNKGTFVSLTIFSKITIIN